MKTEDDSEKPTPTDGAWRGFWYALPFGILSWVLIALAIRSCM